MRIKLDFRSLLRTFILPVAVYDVVVIYSYHMEGVSLSSLTTLVLPPIRNLTFHNFDNARSEDDKDNWNSTISLTWPETATPWPRNSSLKVPFPILITSLPKSATTSSTEFFKCGEQLSFHHICFSKCPPGKVGKRGKIALKVQQNALNGLAPLEGLPRDIFSDFGYEDDEFCFHPSFHLKPFYDSYPNMTILHITRNTTAWLHSIARYDSGKILQRWSNCSQDPLQVFSRLTKDTSAAQWQHLYDRHTRYVRTFAHHHPSITYYEFQLEDPLIAAKLSEAFGISSQCWRRRNKNKQK